LADPQDGRARHHLLYMARRPSTVMQVADRIAVLRDGQVSGSWARDSFDETAMLTASLSQRMGDLGDFEGELTEEPRGWLARCATRWGGCSAGSARDA